MPSSASSGPATWARHRPLNLHKTFAPPRRRRPRAGRAVSERLAPFLPGPVPGPSPARRPLPLEMPERSIGGSTAGTATHWCSPGPTPTSSSTVRRLARSADRRPQRPLPEGAAPGTTTSLRRAVHARFVASSPPSRRRRGPAPRPGQAPHRGRVHRHDVLPLIVDEPHGRADRHGVTADVEPGPALLAVAAEAVSMGAAATAARTTPVGRIDEPRRPPAPPDWTG